MKIAIFSDSYLPQINGVSTVAAAQAAVVSQKHQLIIFTPSYGLERSTQHYGNITIERFPSLPWLTYKQAHVPFFILPQIKKILLKNRIDVVHFHTPAGLGVAGAMLAKELRLPVVGTYHTLFSEMIPYQVPFNHIASLLGEPKLGETSNRQGLIRKIVWEISRKVFNSVDLIISNSPSVKQILIEQGHKGKIEVVSNGIDIKLFKPSKVRHDRLKIVHIGRLSYEKNVQAIIRAFKKVHAKYPKATLEIVGDGPARSYLQSLTGEMDLTGSVNFRGFVQHQNLPSYYQSAGIFATASIMETFGMVILESMACGTPVVGVAATGTKDLITDGTGLLCAKVDDSQIANKIMQIISLSEDEYNKMSRKCVAHAANHDIVKVGKQLEQIYTDLAKPMNSRPNLQPLRALK